MKTFEDELIKILEQVAEAGVECAVGGTPFKTPEENQKDIDDFYNYVKEILHIIIDEYKNYKNLRIYSVFFKI